MAKYAGRKGIYEGTCLFAEIMTKVERMHGNNLLLLNRTGATVSNKKANLKIIGGNSWEFHVDKTPRRIK